MSTPEPLRDGHDPVTGLPDLEEFGRVLDVQIALAQRQEKPLAFVLMDLDGFHAVNEEHGQGVGDQVLVRVAGVLLRHLRLHDHACRTHSDEFALLLTDTDADGAQKCLERIGLELMVLEAGPVNGVSAVHGLAVLEAGETVDALWAKAAHELEVARG